MTRASLLPRRLPLLLLAAVLALLLAVPAVHDAPAAQAQAQKGVVFGYDLSPSVPYNDAVDEGAGTVRVPITVSALPASSLTVGVDAMDVTANDGSDYTFGSRKTVTFNSTDTSRTQFVEFTVTDDSVAETDEILRLELVIPGTPTEQYRVIGDPLTGNAFAYITIVDNDAPSSLTGNTYAITPSVTADEGSNATLTVSLGADAPSGGLAFSVTPSYCRCDPTSVTRGAVAADVGTVPSTVTVAAGSRTATLTIPIATDGLLESNEDFRVTISTAVSGWTAANSYAGTATVIIADRTHLPPQNVAVTPGDGKLTLTWEAPSSWLGASARIFQIQWKRSTSGDSAWNQVFSNGASAGVIGETATSFEFTGPQSGGDVVANRTSYDLRIRAQSVAGGSSLESSWVQVTATPQEQHEVWSADLIVQDLAPASLSGVGCQSSADSGTPTAYSCANTGVLDDDDFTFLGHEYTLATVQYSHTTLSIALASIPTASQVEDLQRLTLHVDGTEYPLAEFGIVATILTTPSGLTVPAPSVGDTVSLKLTLTPEHAGDLDPTFGIGGKVTTPFNTNNSEIRAVAEQSDGKIVAAGYVYNGSYNDIALARYNTDGSLDTSFGTGGVATASFGVTSRANAVAIQSDGKIVVAGFNSYRVSQELIEDFVITRHNTDGSLDTTFSNDGRVNFRFDDRLSVATALAIQSDGKIVVAGYDGVTTDRTFALARLTTAGALDTAFSTDGKVTTDFASGNEDTANAVAIQSDGKIVVAGFTDDGSDQDFALARYTTAGALDTAFSTDGKVTTDFNSGDDQIHALAIDDDDFIVAAGKSGANFAVARYTTAGALDTAFSTDGKHTVDLVSGQSDLAYAMALQSDGKIVVAGRSGAGTDSDFALARLTTAGALDTTFGASGVVTTPFGAYARAHARAYAMAIQSGGEIVAAGYANDLAGHDFALARYDDGGALDDGFGIGGKVTTPLGSAAGDVANAVAVQSDGKIVVAGYANNGTVDQPAVSRYNADGSLDSAFGTGGRVVNSLDAAKEERYHAMAVQSDSKIVLAGYYAWSAADDDSLVTRLNADGSRDTSFDSDGVAAFVFSNIDDRLHAVAVQSDGKIVVAGYTTDSTGEDFALGRLNADGSKDTSFDDDGFVVTDFGDDDRAHAVAIQSDGKIVVAGRAHNGTDQDFALARYNTDGSLDTAFSTDGFVVTDFGGNDRAYAVAVQSDGKIVVFGYANTDLALLRYRSDGALDGDFGTGGKVRTPLANIVSNKGYAMALLADGKILVAGDARDSSNRGRFSLARYRANGTLDAAFGAAGNGTVTTPVGSHGGYANALAIQPDGKIVLAGPVFIGGNQGRHQDFGLARYLAQGTFSSDATLSALAVSESTDGSAFSGTAALTPAFDPDATSYEAAIAEGTTHVKVTPTAGHVGATVTVGLSGGTAEAVASGSASAAIPIAAGTTVVEVVVTAEDGRTTMTYTLSFTVGDEAGEGPPPVRYGDAYWSAALTLGDIRTIALGCGTSPVPCDAPDTLTQDSFTLGGPRVTIDGLNINTSNSTINLSFTSAVPDTLRHGATLVFDGRTFTLADATLNTDGDTVSWDLDDDFPLDAYMVGQTVRVSLHESNPPPDAALWKPPFDPRKLHDDGSYGCRNGATYTGPTGLVHPVDCSDHATMGLTGFSHTANTYAGTLAQAWRVHELYLRPSGARHELVLVTVSASYNDPALPRGFTLVVNHWNGGTDDGVSRLPLSHASVERGDGQVTYRWTLGHDHRSLVSNWRGRVTLGIDYSRTGLSTPVRVHYDGGFRYGEPTDAWSATLTITGSLGGCDNVFSGNECSSTSVLTDDDFTYDGEDYEITRLVTTNNLLGLSLNKAVPAILKSTLTLHVGSRKFPLADATFLGGSNNERLQWSNTGLTWSAGDQPQLRLSAAPVREIGVDGFIHWRPAGVSAYYDGLIAYIPKEFTSVYTREPVLTTHAKLKLSAAYAGSTIEWGKGTHDRHPATFNALAADGFTDPIELEAASSYTHVYVRVTNNGQAAVHRIIIDPPPRTYSLSPQVSVNEGEDPQITLTLGSPATSGGATFAVTASFGDGGADEYDVSSFPATVTVPEGETTAVITIPTIDDVEVEDLLDHEERFTVSVAHSGQPAWAVDPEGTATSVVTIIDNDEPPGGIEPWSIRIVPGDGKLTVTWRMGERPGWEDADVRHALRWSQVSGVWANPRDPRAVGANDGVATEPGAVSYVITGLENDVPTGVFVRSFPGNRRNPGAYNVSERNPESSAWVRVKGELTTPRAPRQTSDGTNNPPTVFVAIGDVTIVNRSGTEDVSLAAVFVDEDSDPVTITAASSDTAVATASVSADHSTLTVSAVSRGTAIVTVTADDGNGGTVDETFTVTVKAAPVAAKSIPDTTSPRADHTLRLPIAGVFTDADGDDLTFTAASSDTAVAAASVWPDGSALALAAKARGTATITVTARDTDGNEVSAAFTVTVKAAPVVAKSIDDVSGLAVDATQDVSLSGVFTDADGDDLTVTAESSDTDKATVTVASDGSKLTLTGVAAGTATVTVTARDTDGNEISDEFEVTVAAAQQQQAKDYSALIAKMWEWRNDPPANADAAKHYNLWDRALLAMGETVEDKTLTPMPASEAQDYADRGWTRWVEVAEALTEIEQAAAQQQQAPANSAPTVASAITDATIVNASGTRSVSLSGVFADADNDSLTITAASSDTAVATTSVSAGYSTLTVTAASRGTATITVTANDGNGGTVSDEFTITVKAAPVVASAIDDVSGLEVDATQDVSLSGVFTDADGDSLTITAASSDTAKTTVSVASDGSRLTLTGVAEGTATITVTARDTDGNTVQDAFDVTVVKKYAALIAQMWEWRNDPPAHADATKHYNLWDRALLAMGETVEDTSLTPMPASEAQDYADRGWTRWVEVAEALKEIEAG